MYENFYMNKVLDFSECLDNSRFYDVKNKKVIGNIEDETKSVSIVQFVGLKSKMYSCIKKYNERGKKAKGINENIVKNMTQEEYRNTFFRQKKMIQEMKRIQSKSVNQ